MTTDITTRFGITEDTTVLTGFTEARVRFSGVGFEGPVPMQAARELIDWAPYETENISGPVLTPEGIKVFTDETRKLIVHPRTGKVMAAPKQSYVVHPYGDTLLTNASVIAESELDIARVGTFGQGARAYVQYEFPENMQAGSKGAEPVAYRPFLNVATSIDGNLATSYFTGSQVIVCDNTLAMALKQSANMGTLRKVRHTKNSLLNVTEVRAALGVVFEVADAFAAEVEKLTAEFVSDEVWAKWVDAMVPLPDVEKGRGLTLAENKRGELNALWNADERVAPWKNSAYGVLAASNTWMNHIQTIKGSTRDERQAAKLIDGTFEKADANALRVLAEVR